MLVFHSRIVVKPYFLFLHIYLDRRALNEFDRGVFSYFFQRRDNHSF